MATIPTCNGWSNYPTWNVALWMDNDQASYHEARELMRVAVADNCEYADDDPDTETLDRDGAIADLAEALKTWHEDVTPDLEGFTADLHGWAMGYVEWREIAAHLVDEREG